ncbi:MAG: serine--tRNA ligase [Bauldia sp.]|nr:serine--tRNA ligase [Bauldia sp.]
MLDIKWIRENPDALDRALRSRNAAPLSARLIALDEQRRAHIAKVQAAQERRNAASKEIGKAKGAGDEGGAAALMAEVAEIKTFLSGAENEERRLEEGLRDELATIPNVPLADVPVGLDETANALRSIHGAARDYAFTPREHYELGEGLRQMDFAAAARMSGSRFVVLKGQLARMERALGQFMLDLHTGQHGYTEVQPPLLVKDEAVFGTAQLPKFREDLFVAGRTGRDSITNRELEDAVRAIRNRDETGSEIGEDGTVQVRLADIGPLFDIQNLWLVPTAEVPLTNLVREQILGEEELPLRFTALTPCFRSEAGASGRDTRGMLRQHQFDKVELVSVTTPEKSREEHERMLACAEEVLKRLDLHYRVVTLCTGDMGFAAQKTYDIEVWLPGQSAFREISSCSACGDFQARRMDARFRPREGKGTRFVHTLNGSGVAVGRALIAVVETYQNADGTVTVPSALAPYMAGITRIGD